MSKKSRKRNKRLLALAGLAGAVALSSKKKRDASIASNEAKESGFAASTKKPTMADVAGPKKTTPKKNIPQDTKVNTGKKETNKKTPIKPFRFLDLGIPEGSKPLKLKDNSIRAKNRLTSAAGSKEPNKPMIASLFPKSKTADNYKADMQDFRRTSQYGATTRDGKEQMKSGGRAGYKSGGSARGCGKALRGFGKAMKGKR